MAGFIITTGPSESIKPMPLAAHVGGEGLASLARAGEVPALCGIWQWQEDKNKHMVFVPRPLFCHFTCISHADMI